MRRPSTPKIGVLLALAGTAAVAAAPQAAIGAEHVYACINGGCGQVAAVPDGPISPSYALHSTLVTACRAGGRQLAVGDASLCQVSPPDSLGGYVDVGPGSVAGQSVAIGSTELESSRNCDGRTQIVRISEQRVLVDGTGARLQEDGC